MRVKALQYMYYNRKEYQTGQEYDMDDREAMEAKLLEMLGKIQIVHVPPPNKVALEAPKYHAATIKPVEEEKHIEEEEHPLISRRRYQRRDMRADK